MYKVKFIHILLEELHFLEQFHLILSYNFFLQKKLVVAIDITHFLYYVDVPNLALHDLNMLASLNNKAMESV
jgi:hypothetical protein